MHFSDPLQRKVVKVEHHEVEQPVYAKHLSDLGEHECALREERLEEDHPPACQKKCPSQRGGVSFQVSDVGVHVSLTLHIMISLSVSVSVSLSYTDWEPAQAI